MRPWMGHVATFLLGLTLAVTFYEGRRLVESTADALSAASALEEPPARERGARKKGGDEVQPLRQRQLPSAPTIGEGDPGDRAKGKRRRRTKAKSGELRFDPSKAGKVKTRRPRQEIDLPPWEGPPPDDELPDEELPPEDDPEDAPF